MGMNPAEFWAMSWRDFQLKQRGFFELRNMDYKSQWEQARMISFWSVRAMTSKRWPRKFKDLGEFPWEENDVKLPTKEEMRYWMLKYGKYLDENGNTYNA
jgi:hypothetical protein